MRTRARPEGSVARGRTRVVVLALVAALVSIACGQTSPSSSERVGDAASANTADVPARIHRASSAASSSAAPASASSASSSAPSGSASPSDEVDERVLTPDELETQNLGCVYRKSTNVMTSCAKSKGSAPKGWSLPVADAVLAVADTTDASAECYCASGLDAFVRKCGGSVGSGAVLIDVGHETDALHCTLDVRGFRAVDGRKFVYLRAWNRDRSVFYSALTVYEIVGGKADFYLGGSFPFTDDLFTDHPTTPNADIEVLTPRARREWPTLPAELKRWLGEGI